MSDPIDTQSEYSAAEDALPSQSYAKPCWIYLPPWPIPITSREFIGERILTGEVSWPGQVFSYSSPKSAGLSGFEYAQVKYHHPLFGCYPNCYDGTYAGQQDDSEWNRKSFQESQSRMHVNAQTYREACQIVSKSHPEDSIRYGIPSRSKISYKGLVPSSVRYRQSRKITTYRQRLKKEEDKRAEENHPRVLRRGDLDPSRQYAKWNGGHIELTDDLFARCICPADLLQHPCRFDELEGGCQMLRLCSELQKYTTHTCPDTPFRHPDLSSSEPSTCPHLHWEVEPSCRFIANDRTCEIVVSKGFDCSCGHDFEHGRKIANARFEAHVRDALAAGASGWIKAKCTVLR